MKGEITFRFFVIIALVIIFFVFMVYLMQRMDYNITDQVRFLPGLFE